MGVIDPDSYEELYNEGQGGVYLEFMGFIGCLFKLPRSVVLVNEHFHYPWPNKESQLKVQTTFPRACVPHRESNPGQSRC